MKPDCHLLLCSTTCSIAFMGSIANTPKNSLKMGLKLLSDKEYSACPMSILLLWWSQGKTGFLPLWFHYGWSCTNMKDWMVTPHNNPLGKNGWGHNFKSHHCTINWSRWPGKAGERWIEKWCLWIASNRNYYKRE